MEAIKITISPCDSNILHPLYHKYQQELEAQPAYVELDIRTGSLHADWDANVGNGAAPDVWHGLRRQYTILNILTTDEINRLLTEIAPIAQRILDGAEVVSDGLQDRPVLSEQAQAAEEELTDVCRAAGTTSIGIIDAAMYYGEVSTAHLHDVTAQVKADTTDEQLSALVEEAQLDGRTDGATITGLDDYFAELRDYMRGFDEG